MPAAAPSLAQAYDQQKRRTTMTILLIVGAAALAAAVIGVTKGMKALGVRTSPDNVQALAAKGSRPDANVLAAAGKPSEPVLNRGVEDPKQMPADVLAWLKHLERCEQMKVEIAGDQAAEVSVWMQKNSVLGAGMGLLDPYDQSGTDGGEEPAEYTKGKLLNLRPRWDELIAHFRSVPPPEECRPLASDFDRAIVMVPALMGDLGDILNGAAADPQSALQSVKKMQNSSYGDIDRYFARADEKLSQICQKYDHNKWFNIKPDVMAGGMLGKFSGLGL